jgi:hypothetical protein
MVDSIGGAMIAQRNQHADLAGPVVISGLGGSGTRLVYRLVEEMGVYLGADLNDQRDYLPSILLFKQARWWARHRRPAQDEADVGFEILERALTGRRGLNPRQLAFLARAALEIGRHGHNAKGHGSGWKWPRRRARALLLPGLPQPGAVAWGWKDPTMHVYLGELAAHFPGLRYIHVIRDGLDIAYRRKEEISAWGWLYGVQLPRSKKKRLRAKLKYWARANRRAIEIGTDALGERFLLVNYDRLCREPGPEIDRIAALLGVEPEQPELERLRAIPGPAPVHAKQPELDLFDEEDLAVLHELGFR